MSQDLGNGLEGVKTSDLQSAVPLKNGDVVIVLQDGVLKKSPASNFVSDWGGIGGSISDQADLIALLSDYSQVSDLNDNYVPYVGANKDIDLGNEFRISANLFYAKDSDGNVATYRANGIYASNGLMVDYDTGLTAFACDSFAFSVADDMGGTHQALRLQSNGSGGYNNTISQLSIQQAPVNVHDAVRLSDLGNYVPYTGALRDVSLGNHSFSAFDLTSSNGGNSTLYSSNSLEASSGLHIVYGPGASVFQSFGFVFDVTNDLTGLNEAFRLQSNGGGGFNNIIQQLSIVEAPVNSEDAVRLTDLSNFVPYTGAIQGVDLGFYHLTQSGYAVLNVNDNDARYLNKTDDETINGNWQFNQPVLLAGPYNYVTGDLNVFGSVVSGNIAFNSAYSGMSWQIEFEDDATASKVLIHNHLHPGIKIGWLAGMDNGRIYDWNDNRFLLETDIDLFVPYSGAAGAVDLNNQTLKNVGQLVIQGTDPYTTGASLSALDVVFGGYFITGQANIDTADLDFFYTKSSGGGLFVGYNRSNGNGEIDYISLIGSILDGAGGHRFIGVDSSGHEDILLDIDSVGNLTIGNVDDADASPSGMFIYEGGSFQVRKRAIADIFDDITGGLEDTDGVSPDKLITIVKGGTTYKLLAVSVD